MALKGKVALVSGGSRGIGKAVALALAEKGSKIAFIYFNSEKEAEEVIKEGENLLGTIRAYKADIRNKQQVKAVVAAVIEEWGAIDIVVNNAGIRKDKTLAFMAAEDWNEVLETNIGGPFNLTQAAIYYMLKKRSGRIINISSVSGISGIAGQTNYSSSKAALIGFTKALAKEVAKYGIAVNAVAPGGVETDMLRGLTDKEKEKLISTVPAGRLCRVDEVTSVVLFLADSDCAPDYLTGTTIPLDGGMGL